MLTGQNILPRLLVSGLPLLVVLVLVSGCAGPRPGGIQAGPLYDNRPDFEGHEGFRALGPWVERREAADGRTFMAVRPFWSRVSNPDQDRAVTDIVWPLGMFKTRQGELDWRLLTAFGHDFDLAASGSRHRWALFPVLFGGRTAAGDSYFAIFPLGGALHEFLGRDRNWFFLFPLYLNSQQGDNRTTSVLWPVYSRTTGGDITRWRVWPLYGYSHTPDRWTKRFALWPIWTSVQYHYPEMAGGGFILFPLYGQVDLPGRRSRMFLPPFFKFEWGEDGHRAWNAPWPLLQYVDGIHAQRLYVFPLGGRRRSGNDQYWFALWPVFSGHRTERPREIFTRFRILPFWYHEHLQARGSGDEVAGDVQGESLSRYMRLWPLWLYRREGEHSVMRVPDLWPLRQTPGIERNWAPLWTLYQREQAGARRTTSLLWGLVHTERDGDRRQTRIFPVLDRERDGADRSWRFLYGLAGYRRDGLQRSYQLLYFLRMSRTSEATEEPETGVDSL